MPIHYDHQLVIFSIILAHKVSSALAEGFAPRMFTIAELLADIHQELLATCIDKQQYTLTGLFILYHDILSRLPDL